MTTLSFDIAVLELMLPLSVGAVGMGLGFGAAALIDGDIDKHAALRHHPQHFAGDQVRSLSARYKYSTNDQIVRWKKLTNVIFI